MSENSSNDTPIPPSAKDWNSQAEHWIDPDRHPILASPNRERLRAITDALAQFRQEFIDADSILDIGSGGGVQMYVPDIDISQRTVAFDIASEPLAGNSAATKQQGDANEPLPFPSDRFTMVTQLFLNRYLHDQQAELEEILRVLTPGGRFIIVDHSTIVHPAEVDMFIPGRLITPSVRQQSPDVTEHIIYRGGQKDLAKRKYQGPVHLLTGTKRAA